MIIRELGLVDFHRACSIQEELVASLASGSGEETLLLLEHHPVYTIGSGGKEGNVLDPAVTVVRTNRGGDVTYHGPGQLVGYPIIDLSMRGRDLHRYLRFLEEMVIRVASEFGVEAGRVPGRTGVWCGKDGAARKLASIGVGVRRWIAMHGFAINVCNDPAPFAGINPCGIVSCPMTSLSMEAGAAVGVGDVAARFAERFESFAGELLPLT